ncbi:MAG: thiamine pyrophosphate-binding protein [Nitrospina sp.]|nr:thiamine pyrophosphate-binding protein [Nitrospina sp.]
MKVSDYIAYFLENKKIDHVFELSGGMITHLLDSIHQRGATRIVSVHHEQTAAFAADAVGRLTGKPGVALATSGPGATNLLTGIGSCFFDSSPAIFITGQVNRSELKQQREIRQLGFQETDIVSMAKTVTKAAWQVNIPEDLPGVLEDAFQLATAGRPGPVLIDIPMDVQRSDLNLESIQPIKKRQDTNPITPNSPLLVELLNDLKEAKKPLILAGGGVFASQSLDVFRQFIELVSVPVVHSLLGAGTVPYNHAQYVGFIGTYGNRWANLALSECDCLLVLGSRLDIRQTGSDTADFVMGKKVYHVDCEAGEINNRLTGTRAVLSDLPSFFEAVFSLLRSATFVRKKDWFARINELKKKWPDTNELKNIDGMNPNTFFHALSQSSGDAFGFFVDVGAHQMWAAQSLELLKNQRLITSGGMGAMGFSLPAAIGGSIVMGMPVVVIAGDGGMQINIQELQTVFQNKLPIKIIVLNNQCLGMIRQFQESYFDSRYVSTVLGYSAPDFSKVAAAYGIPSRTISKEEETATSLDWLWEDPESPTLLQVMIDPKTGIYPKIAFGKSISEMEPFSKPHKM